MSDLLERVVVPIASETDAEATAAAVVGRVADVDGEIIAVHVIEKAGGAPDKTGVEQRRDAAEDAFTVLEAAAADAGVPVERDLRFHTDVVDAIFEAAADYDATAVAFTPRGGSRWLDLLTGDRSRALVKRAELPVVVFPEADDE